MDPADAKNHSKKSGKNASFSSFLLIWHILKKGLPTDFITYFDSSICTLSEKNNQSGLHCCNFFIYCLEKQCMDQFFQNGKFTGGTPN